MLQYYDGMPDKLSSNSYAVLGMLAIRPWTPYELTQQFRRSLAFCWPVSERLVYTEPDKLVREGLAKVRTSRNGERDRRVYSITPAGRKILREWLATAPAPPRIFNEPLLRVLFADQGEPADLLQSLESFRAYLHEQMLSGQAHTKEYLDGTGPFPERSHLIAVFADLNHRIFTAMEQWIEDTVAEVSDWPTTKALGLTPEAAEAFERAVDLPARVTH